MYNPKPPTPCTLYSPCLRSVASISYTLIQYVYFRYDTFGSRLVYLIHLRERVVERRARKPVVFPQCKRGALTISSEYRSPVPAPPRPWSLYEKRQQSPHPPVPFASASTAPSIPATDGSCKAALDGRKQGFGPGYGRRTHRPP